MADAMKSYVRGRAAERKATPQTKRTPGRTDEVKNNAGGFAFKVKDVDRLRRLLILGAAGNTYYVDAKTQAKDAFKFLEKMIASDEQTVIDEVRAVSLEGRAHRQTMTLFAMAMLMHYGKEREQIRALFLEVVRTATHLYEVCQNIDDLGGWGTGKVKTLAMWFTSKPADALAYQAVKYRSRVV